MYMYNCMPLNTVTLAGWGVGGGVVVFGGEALSPPPPQYID